MLEPFGAGFKVLLESNVSEEKLGVSVHGGHDLGCGDDLTDLADRVAKSLWSFKAPEIPKGMADLDATTGEGIEIRTVPLVWEVAGVSWAELALEWPDWVWLVVSVLIVVRESLEGHVSDVLGDLGKLCVGGHQIALVGWNVNVGVVNWSQKVESPWVTFEGVEGEAVSCVNAISEELESSRSRGDDIGGDGTDF